MSKIYQFKAKNRLFLFFILYCFACSASFSQKATIIQGAIKDSLTRESLPFVTIQFDGTTIGTFSDEEGAFKLANRTNNTEVTISFIGYHSRKIVIPAEKTTVIKEILLKPESMQLNEIVVRPKNEKYSKKNNPAVELIKKVIEHKNDNNITAQNYYQNKEYDRILLALNDFKPDQAQFKRYKFLPGYADTSLIDDKPILPISVRETLSDSYYQKDPKTNKRIVKAYNISGIDQMIETEGIDAIVKEVFKDVNIYDNTITLLFHNFIGPLSEHSAVNFYRWYLADTVAIENNQYIKLDFAPFNSRDVGFTGSLYISTDSSYVVKRAILRTPKKININFVDELVIRQEFTELSPRVWVPKEQRMAIDLSLIDAVKFYVDKSRTFNDFVFEQPKDSIFQISAPVVFEKDYDSKSKDYWVESRLANNQKDYRMDALVADMKNVFLFKVMFGAANVISAGYIPTSKDEKKNKLDLGTVATVYSYNSVEGNRFRLTASTTPNFHPHLFLYGYGAYGTKDNQFKYYGEATWAFNNVKNHKDEYPKNNLVIAYKYDMNNLGQRFTQAERDNILMSIKSSKNEKLTYNRQTQVAYEREFYGGFSFRLSGQTFDERPAGKLTFEKIDDLGNKYQVPDIRTTETTLTLRYSPNEKFFQQRRKRNSIPSEKFITNLSYTKGWENTLGGQYNYDKATFSLYKELWIAPYGKLITSVSAEKIWGETPFPFLIAPSANNSFTIQKGSFNLIEPLEFVHDAQVSWDVNYHMGGWLFNRVPFLKVLKWREVAGFRGFYGELSERNNPLYNSDMLLFPQRTYTTDHNTPYMEYNIGIENIFKFFRIDYVRRVNYLNHSGVSKNGFRISFDMTF